MYEIFVLDPDNNQWISVGAYRQYEKVEVIKNQIERKGYQCEIRELQLDGVEQGNLGGRSHPYFKPKVFRPHIVGR